LTLNIENRSVDLNLGNTDDLYEDNQVFKPAAEAWTYLEMDNIYFKDGPKFAE
jgi:hypothetical protein